MARPWSNSALTARMLSAKTEAEARVLEAVWPKFFSEEESVADVFERVAGSIALVPSKLCRLRLRGYLLFRVAANTTHYSLLLYSLL